MHKRELSAFEQPTLSYWGSLMANDRKHSLDAERLLRLQRYEQQFDVLRIGAYPEVGAASAVARSLRADPAGWMT